MCGQTTLNGYYSRFILSRVRGHLGVTYESISISPGFDSNDFGITGQTDRIFNCASIGWKKYEPGEIFRYYMTNYNGTLLSNFGGDLPIPFKLKCFILSSKVNISLSS